MENNYPPFQQTVARFVRDHDMEVAVPIRLLDLTAELGELAKEALKSSRYGEATFQPTEPWRAELGDCFFSLICVANSSGIDLEAALRASLERYEQRIREHGEPGSGK